MHFNIVTAGGQYNECGQNQSLCIICHCLKFEVKFLIFMVYFYSISDVALSLHFPPSIAIGPISTDLYFYL